MTFRIIVALSLLASNAYAQSTIASVAYEETFPAEVAPDTPGVDTELRIRTLRVRGGFPIRVPGSKAIVIPGLSYGVTMPRTEGGGRVPDDIHELGVNLTTLVSLSERWRLSFGGAFQLATDFSDVDERHLRATLQLAAQYQPHQRFSFGFGLAANYNLGSLLPLPVILVDWLPVDYFRLRIALPQSLAILFRIGDRVELGLSAQLRGNSYAINNATTIDGVRVSSLRAGITASVRITKGLWFSLTGARTVFRRFDFFDGDEEIDSLEPDNAFVLEAALEYRVGARPTEAAAPQDASVAGARGGSSAELLRSSGGQTR